MAGSWVSSGPQPWPLFGQALPPPPTTRALEWCSCPRVMALQAAGLPLVAILGAGSSHGHVQGLDPAPGVSPRQSFQPSEEWVLEARNKPTLFPASLSKTSHILRMFCSVFLPSWQGSASPRKWCSTAPLAAGLRQLWLVVRRAPVLRSWSSRAVSKCSGMGRELGGGP